MLRGIWKGALGFGLVNCPVSLVSAESHDELDFDLLDRRDMNRIVYRKVNKESGEEVPAGEIVKGFAVEEGRYVVLEDEDFRNANGEANRSVAIREFVLASEIDPRFFERPYFPVPEKNALKTCLLLRGSLHESGRVGIGTMVLHGRQHVCAVMPLAKVLVLEFLRFAHELRSADEVSLPEPGKGQEGPSGSRTRDGQGTRRNDERALGAGEIPGRLPERSPFPHRGKGAPRHRHAAPRSRYNEMRDFSKTAEPRGEERASDPGRLVFVVQKHDASHLHYDFRLEIDGVLKSWAVPKGPSLDPAVKRLAMETEDHPMDYRTFEGVIPKGEYGGGTLMVWDLGLWVPEGDPVQGYGKGWLRFLLEGEKLGGRWTLARTGSQGGKAAWLLIKSRDDVARPESVATGRSMEEIAAGKPSVVLGTELPGVRKMALPRFVEPRLATLVKQVPEGEAWIHEIKWDGYRLLARIERGAVELLTRGGLNRSDRFPSTAEALRGIPADRALFDGEVVVLDAQGKPSYQALQNALKKRTSHMHYFVFDVLHANGLDLRNVPLRQRKVFLEALLKLAPHPQVHNCDHVEGNGRRFAEALRGRGLEGVVSKRGDARYSEGRGAIGLAQNGVFERAGIRGGGIHAGERSSGRRARRLSARGLRFRSTQVRG